MEEPQLPTGIFGDWFLDLDEQRSTRGIYKYQAIATNLDENSWSCSKVVHLYNWQGEHRSYIDDFSTAGRLYSSLSYVSPNEFEAGFRNLNWLGLKPANSEAMI